MKEIEDAILERAIELLQAGWCQNEQAKKKNGRYTFPEDDEATSFCATGAIARAMKDLGIGISHQASGFVDLDNPYAIGVMQRILRSLGGCGYRFSDEQEEVQYLNDCAEGSENVILMFKRALHG